MYELRAKTIKVSENCKNPNKLPAPLGEFVREDVAKMTELRQGGAAHSAKKKVFQFLNLK